MSGHSKWSTIKRKKGAADQKRGNLFTKLSKNIAVAARRGKDPEMNSALRTAIDNARGANMPKANIEKAILRGAGELPGQQLEEITYEGYGPSGVAVLIRCITDNKNRTTSFIKSTITKAGGSLGGPNSVAYMFKPKGVIRIENASEEIQLKAIDTGAQDVIEEQGGLTIYTSPADLDKIKRTLGEVDYADTEMVADTETQLDDSTQQKIDKFIQELEDNDDVDTVYTNAA